VTKICIVDYMLMWRGEGLKMSLKFSDRYVL
jgi:hypothetical protein